MASIQIPAPPFPENISMLARSRLMLYSRHSQVLINLTENLASAKATLGLYLASGLQPDHRLGLGYVAQAIDLYKESLAELTAPDAIKIVRGGVSHLLKLIKQQASQFRAYEIVRDHQIDMLIISRQRNDENLFNIIKLGLENTIIEMLSLPDRAILPFNMAPNSKIIADLQSVLLSSGIPRTEWPDLLAKVLSPAEIPLPGEAGQLEGAPEAGQDQASSQAPANPEEEGNPYLPRPRWESRSDEDKDLSSEAFVRKYYAAEKALVSPRPQWEKDGDYGNSPAEFIAMAYAPEMMAGTLHRALVAHEQKEKIIVKLASGLRTHAMPEGIDIPTLPEWNLRQLNARLKDDNGPIRPGRIRTDAERIYDTARYRTSKL